MHATWYSINKDLRFLLLIVSWTVIESKDESFHKDKASGVVISIMFYVNRL